jgi:hypothetical protein
MIKYQSMIRKLKLFQAFKDHGGGKECKTVYYAFPSNFVITTWSRVKNIIF